MPKATVKQINSKNKKAIENKFHALFSSVGPEIVNRIDILVCKCNIIPLHMSFVLRSHPLSEQFNFKPMDSHRAVLSA